MPVCVVINSIRNYFPSAGFGHPEKSIHMRLTGRSQILWPAVLEFFQSRAIAPKKCFGFNLIFIYRFISLQSSILSLNRFSNRLYCIYFYRVFTLFVMSQHNETEPPPLEKVSNTVTTSKVLSVNTQTEGSTDTGKNQAPRGVL